MWFKKKKQTDTGYFSQQWMNDWKDNLNESDTYSHHGKNWNTFVILKFDILPDRLKKIEAEGIYLDLNYGKCESIRYATKEDEDIADVILKAQEKTWIKLIEQKSDPTKQIMMGKVKLEKGSLVLLSTQRKAAMTLIECAPALQNGTQHKEHSPVNKTEQVKSKTHYKTTSSGLDHDSFPMKLFQKAKQFGIWNPSEIDLSTDKEHWKNLSNEEKEIIYHLISIFMAGEEAVTTDLLPLINIIAREGRLEEEIYLTSFLWEEAKHVEFFSLYKNNVLNQIPDPTKYHKPFYKVIFYEKLPRAMAQLQVDNSPESILKASITYNMIVEGTLAETGYAAFYNMLEKEDLLPGLREGITKLKMDESRHIAYGLFLINRILDENPKLTHYAEEELTTLLNDATNIIHEIFEPYEEVPFGLEKEWFLEYAIKQFQARIQKLGLK